MLLFNVRNRNQGFTLFETLVIVIIIGILSAIAAPSFLALLNRSKVNDAVNQVRGALQEAQREAIRKSTSCSITLNTASNTITGPCLVTGNRTLPNGVAMANNINGVITFSIRGNTTFAVPSSSASPSDTSGKIILYESDGSTSGRRCVALSNGIGIIRSGTYSGPINTATNITDSGICNASE